MTQATSRVDELVERAGRWMAARTTRRGFLGTAGRAGVLVAAGATMATFLADRAEARVCGQSGVAPKCDTFVCTATWGWCWYASGCCANGATKKICDCCAPNTPHPVGYCPSGTRVKCIVESCGADPRLLAKPTVVLGSDDPVAVAVEVSRRRRDRAPVVVVGDADDALHAAVAASLTGVADGPVLLTGRGGLAGTVAEEIGRLGAEFALVAGPRLPGSVDDALRGRGVHVTRIGSAEDAGVFSAEAATWARERTGGRTAVLVAGSVMGAVAGAAAAAAACRRWPLLLGTGAAVRDALTSPRRVQRTFVATDDRAHADGIPGAEALVGGPTQLAAALADRAVVAGWEGGTVGIACHRDRTAAALASLGGPTLLHEPGTLDGARAWLLKRRDRLDAAYAAGTRTTFPAQAEYDVQALLNVFETHELRGRAGEGLPVIPQPRSERPIGRARW